MRCMKKRVLAHLTEKFTTLRSERTALAYLKVTLSKLKSNNGSCKERLHCWVTLATAQLHCSADCALEAANRTLVLISVEEEARLKKLEEDLRKLESRQAAQGQVADDVRQGKVSGVDDATGGTSPCVTIGGSGSGELHFFSSPAPESEYQRSNNHFHVLMD
ncbi:unnamed protein product [Dibothriocephalus latus]|uniref:Uncharacterized protein n=1 Tax=Dibothriocephalus latus TaxID=60516 RepID=A0A3P7PGW2_DIBLA|nr:unnamed protein product [Dibothriocephalus latus]